MFCLTFAVATHLEPEILIVDEVLAVGDLALIPFFGKAKKYWLPDIPDLKAVGLPCGYKIWESMSQSIHWIVVELTAENHKMLYIPKGFAHGFQSLADNTEVFYQMSAFFHPDCARGVQWDDLAFKIEWPKIERIISEKDLQYSYL